ncbi:ATP-binding protein [Glutamicibacter sp. AGC46]
MHQIAEHLWKKETILPDPSTVAAIGRHHDFKSALADLVDNSIDANATRVRIRFVQRKSSIVSIQVIDNGRGMSESELKLAMTFGARRDYTASDLGYFGLGLKAASLSQATAFEVYSRKEWGLAVGRRMDRNVSKDFRVGVLADGHANERLDNLSGIEFSHGTVVEWFGLEDVIHTSDVEETIEWRNERLRTIREHLGIIFHRHLQSDKVQIDIDTYDADRQRTLPPTRVDPIDPFQDSLTTSTYPQEFEIVLPDGTTSAMQMHIFPARLATASFNLYNEPGESRQGIFAYRRGRLLTVGQNWAGARVRKKEYALGRIKIDLDESNEHLVSINPEKIAPSYSEDLIRGIAKSHAVGNYSHNLDKYFADLVAHHRESRKTKKKEIQLVEPGAGLNPTIMRILEDLQDFADFETIDIRIMSLPEDELFRADRIGRRIDINLEFIRKVYGLDRRLDNSDAQILKVLLYLLLESDFKVEQRWTGNREGKHRLINSVLLQALKEDFGSHFTDERGN